MPLVEATDTVLRRPVVLRTLSPALALEPSRRTRFLEAAALVARVRSPHIAQVLDVGGHDGSPYVVMERPAGRALREIVEATGPQPLDWCVDVASQLCGALASAHRHGLVQLGLRPDGSFVTPEGRVTVVPFGTIAIQGTGGTLAALSLRDVAYLAPEIVAGRVPDRRADLFTLGVMLYELLSGRRPFQGKSIPALLIALVHERPDLAQLPRDGRYPGLAALVERALAPDPEARHPDAESLLLDLETLACEAATPAPAPAASPAEPHLDRLRAEALEHAVAGRLAEARAQLEDLERRAPGDARNEELRAYVRSEEAAENGEALLDVGQHQLALGNFLTARAAAVAALALEPCRTRAQELLLHIDRRRASGDGAAAGPAPPPATEPARRPATARWAWRAPSWFRRTHS